MDENCENTSQLIIKLNNLITSKKLNSSEESEQKNIMSKNVDKYLHKHMDKVAGIEHTYHRTKIVATVGPACDTYEKLLELVKCGVNVFSLNFSNGSHE